MKNFGSMLGAVVSAALMAVGCANDIHENAQIGFPDRVTDSGGSCDESDAHVFLGPREGAYFVGTIERIEPVLDGARANFTQTNVYTNREQYRCGKDGYASLKMQFRDVSTSWDGRLDSFTVYVPAEEFRDLATRPVIAAGKFNLVWEVVEGKARFPQYGVRMGMSVKGSTDGRNVGSFENVLEIRPNGEVEWHYAGACHTLADVPLHNENDIFVALQNAPYSKGIIRERDLSWSMTSVCQL